MKIKTKKQLNLPQLIEWAMENDVDNTIFIGKKNLYNVCFNKNGLMYFNTTSPIPTGEIFTVEIEEEITEDTRFEHMIEITEDDLHITWQNTKIDWEKDEESKEFHAYIDGEFKCIWRDGKLVK
ncbi:MULTISPECIES: hypothetical protein [Staphylococcus]|uniref:hypothetical protein n=1 Tax=Staphylococcus TaxID=1279 RepID=UPI003F567344